jgi:hypothetical protein
VENTTTMGCNARKTYNKQIIAVEGKIMAIFYN